ncbi:MAG: hypothetical protein IJZ80_08515 [Clostridia bacterium]|nr:hypothetical protein [Clostridia bacterium]
MGAQNQIFYLVGAIVGGIAIGGFCGLISLIVGFIKKRKLLGFIGFGISIVFGVLMAAVLHQPAFLSCFPSAIMAGIILLLTRKRK